MSWLITGSEKTPVDPQFGSVSLLLHGNGTTGSTTITDSSPSPKTVTAVNGAQITTSESKFGGASISLAASISYSSVPASDVFNFGAGDFTIEAWVKFNSAGDSTIVGGIGPTAGSLMLRRLANGTFSIGRNLVAFDTTSSVLSWNTTQFYHLAATKSSGTAYLFRDGILIASGANTQSYALAAGTDTTWAVGASHVSSGSVSPGQYLNGYIDDLRITKGIARYTANFTPPTAPFPDI